MIHTISLNLGGRQGLYYTHSTDEDIEASLFNRERGLTQVFRILYLHHHPAQMSNLTTAIPGVTDLTFATYRLCLL